MKKLYRSRKNRVMLGVLGGLGEYLEADPTVVRLIFIVLLFITGVLPCTLAYFISAMVIPQATE